MSDPNGTTYVAITMAIVAIIAAIIAQVFASKAMRLAAVELRMDRAASRDKQSSTRSGQ